MLKILKRDFLLDWKKTFLKVSFLLLIFITVVYLNAYLLNDALIIKNNDLVSSNGNYMSLFFKIFAEFKEIPKMPPFLWILIMISIPFIIGDSLKKDFLNNSIYIFVRKQKIANYFYSKLTYVVIITMVFYIFLFILFFLGGCILNDKTFSFSESILTTYSIPENLINIPLLFIILSFSLYTLTGVLISIIYYLETLFFNSKIVFSLILLCILFSIYIEAPTLPFGLSIVLRNSIAGGSSPYFFGVFYLLILIIISILIGRYLFIKKDIF